MANSIGGFWALLFGLAFPDRVSRLVLAGSPAGLYPRVPPVFRPMAMRGLNRLLEPFMARSTHGQCRALFSRLAVAHIERVPEAYLECVYQTLRLPGFTRGYLSLVEELTTPWGWRTEYRLRPEMARLKVPPLFLWGDRDYFIHPAFGEEVARTMPDARVEPLPGAGHLPWFDEPALCAAHTAEFLSS